MRITLKIFIGVLATITLALAVMFIIPSTRNSISNLLTKESSEYQTIVYEKDNLNDTLTNVNSELEVLREQLNTKNGDLAIQASELEELSQTLESLRQNYNQKISQINSLVNEINNKDNVIANKDNIILNKNNIINQLNDDLFWLDQEVMNLQEQVFELENYIYMLENQDYEEITDFVFYGNEVRAYLGSDSVVDIPSSYSVLKDVNNNNVVRTEYIPINDETALYYAYRDRDVDYINATITDSNGFSVSLDSVYNFYDISTNTTFENIFQYPLTLTVARDIFIVGDEIEVTSIGKNCFNGNQNVIDVNLPNTITTIGKNAFSGLNISFIEIPDSVVVIGEEAFMHCENLQDIILSSNLQLIDYGAFCHCKSLTNIDIPSSVNSIGMYVFQGCNNLQTVNIYSDNISCKYSSSYYPDKTFDNECGWFLYSNTGLILHIPSNITTPENVYGSTWNYYSSVSYGRRLNYYADLPSDSNQSQGETYTVTFIVDGNVYHSYQSEKNVNVALPSNPPALNNVPFTGWNVTENAPFVVPVESLFVISDMTFYAVFGGVS